MPWSFDVVASPFNDVPWSLNRETARLYDKPGLAEYEAIEGFVRWKELDGD